MAQMTPCEHHHKMLEKTTFFQVVALLLTLAGLAWGATTFSSASVTQVEAVQKQTDNQQTQMRDMRQEINTRFDRLEKKIDSLMRERLR